MVYIAALIIMIGLFSYTLFNRKDIAVDILRDRNSFYRVVDSKTLENVYKLKIMNKSANPQSYSVTATGLDGEMIVVVDEQYVNRVSEAGGILSLPVKVRAKKDIVKKHIQNIKLHIQVNGEDGTVVTEKTKYFGPR
jgi:polyferredoxin